jgi:BirA family transcriptional regulator, biotin operon repressor / biotin---[acetyl-CoA-carboxylase] ligase
MAAMVTIPIRNPFPGAVSLLLESAESTQLEARRLAGAGFPHGSLVAAEVQSAGRGRFPERRWESEAGKNLLFTLFLEPGGPAPGAPQPGLPIRIGLALCGAVAAWRLAPRLKWPNDLMLADRKAAGVLCEAGPSGVFAGIGLNCNQVDFPHGLEAATSLCRELGREVDRWALLELFLGKLADSLGDAGWRRKAEAVLWKRGEAATFLPGRRGSGAGAGQGALSGTIEGLDGDGSLLFRATGSASALAYAAGELSRPS